MDKVDDESLESFRLNAAENSCCITDKVPRKGCHCYKFIMYLPDLCNMISEEITTNILLPLEKYYPIINRICTYLPVHHLTMLQSIIATKSQSQNWAAAICAEILKRTEFNWQTADYEPCNICNTEKCGPKVYHPIRYSPCLFRTNLTNMLIFYDDDVIALEQDVHFYTPQTSRKETKPFVDFLFNDTTLLPNIKNVSLGVQNIHFAEPYITTDKKSPYCCIYFPQIPNVSIFQFYYGKTRDDNIFDEVISSDEKLECLLMFTTCERPTTLIKKAIKYLGDVQPMNITIGGGCVWGMTTQTTDERRISFDKHDMYCVAFKTCRNQAHKFFSASIVIPESDNFETQVLQFKSNLEFREEQVLLRFTCFDKKHKQQENAVLRKHFKCPITQMDVNGEIGVDHFTEEHRTTVPEPQTAKRRKGSAGGNYFYGFTTILVFISWGNLKNTTNANLCSNNNSFTRNNFYINNNMNKGSCVINSLGDVNQAGSSGNRINSNNFS